jgi:hypothetical protein
LPAEAGNRTRLIGGLTFFPMTRLAAIGELLIGDDV